jgi:NADH:ubiquinone oxidoreductase subunit E
MEVDIIEKTHEIISRWGKKRENVIEIMHDLQNEFNYLPHEVVMEISREAQVPLSSIYHLATFFNAFSLKPKGKNQVCVCMGTACYAFGAPKIVTVLEKELGIKIGEMTEDMNFGLELVRCVGACGIAPVVSVGKDLYGKVTGSGVAKILRKYESKK